MKLVWQERLLQDVRAFRSLSESFCGEWVPGTAVTSNWDGTADNIVGYVHGDYIVHRWGELYRATHIATGIHAGHQFPLEHAKLLACILESRVEWVENRLSRTFARDAYTISDYVYHQKWENLRQHLLTIPGTVL